MALSDTEKIQPMTPPSVPPSAADKKRPQSAEPEVGSSAAQSVEDAGSSWRDRLKRHRVEMASRKVWVPDTWGQEGSLLKDWDCEVGRSAALDNALFPAGLLAARESLVEECRRRSGRGAGRTTPAPASVLPVVSNSC